MLRGRGGRGCGTSLRRDGLFSQEWWGTVIPFLHLVSLVSRRFEFLLVCQALCYVLGSHSEQNEVCSPQIYMLVGETDKKQTRQMIGREELW